MRRVMIIGGSGSGKSTFARRLGERTGLPVVHMDSLFRRSGWIESKKLDFLHRVDAVVASDRWIMDGDYSPTWPGRFARADTLIFLDLPTWVRFWRVIRRRWSTYGQIRSDLPPRSPEQIDPGFLSDWFEWVLFLFRWVLQYRWRGRSKALAVIASDGPGAHLTRHHLTSRAAVDRFLSSVGGV